MASPLPTIVPVSLYLHRLGLPIDRPFLHFPTVHSTINVSTLTISIFHSIHSLATAHHQPTNTRGSCQEQHDPKQREAAPFPLPAARLSRTQAEMTQLTQLQSTSAALVPQLAVAESWNAVLHAHSAVAHLRLVCLVFLTSRRTR